MFTRLGKEYFITNPDSIVLKLSNACFTPFYIIKQEVWSEPKIVWLEIDPAKSKPIEREYRFNLPRWLCFAVSVVLVAPAFFIGLLILKISSPSFSPEWIGKRKFKRLEKFRDDLYSPYLFQKRYPLATKIENPIATKVENPRKPTFEKQNSLPEVPNDIQEATFEKWNELPKDIQEFVLKIVVGKDQQIRSKLSLVSWQFYRDLNASSIWESLIKENGISLHFSPHVEAVQKIAKMKQILFLEKSHPSCLKQDNEYLAKMFGNEELYYNLPLIEVRVNDLKYAQNESRIQKYGMVLNGYDKIEELKKHSIARVFDSNGLNGIFVQCKENLSSSKQEQPFFLFVFAKENKDGKMELDLMGLQDHSFMIERLLEILGFGQISAANPNPIRIPQMPHEEFFSKLLGQEFIYLMGYGSKSIMMKWQIRATKQEEVDNASLIQTPDNKSIKE